MKVLVTGANGQVGSEIVQLGTVLGLSIIALGRDELDITQIENVSDVMAANQPDIVINAAAYTAVDNAETDFERAYAINEKGVENLALVCTKQNILLIHISTDYVFDGVKKTSYSEKDIPNPTGVYGKSKLKGEQAIAAVLTQYYIVRVSWVFGEKGNNFVRTMLNLGKEREELKIVSDQTGCPTCAYDIAATLLTMAARHYENKPIPYGIYHYVGKESISWHGFAQVIFQSAEKLNLIDRSPQLTPINTSEYPTRAKRPENSVLDCRKIEQALDITQPNWLLGLNNVFKAWKKQ